jgi:L-amino acid N-acyltransferase YncA
MRHGFSGVGRLQGAGIKLGDLFDVILMQKILKIFSETFHADFCIPS